MEKQRGCSVLTFNAGLFEVRAFGLRVVKPAPFIEERFKALAPALANSGADIVLLQEVFDPRHRASLVMSLEHVYPFVALHESDARWMNQGHGLMVLSKHQIAASAFVRFNAQSPVERLFVEKGYLITDIYMAGLGRFIVLNTHVVAGINPESPRAEAVRGRQLDQLGRGQAWIDCPVILGGDFNAGPEASAVNYRQMLDQGYADTFTEVLRLADGTQVTWDPDNPLNAEGPHWSCPPQRCDHLLLKRKDGCFPHRIRESRIVFTEPLVAIGSDNPVPLSDHYGVQTTFE